jgi:hypothetical protein
MTRPPLRRPDQLSPDRAADPLVTGAIAPYWAMQDLTLAYVENEAQIRTRRLRKDEDHHSKAVDEIVGPYRSSLQRAREDEPEVQDELTLEDVCIVPAIAAQGSQPGGVRLPVGRFPLSAVSAWWLVEGPAIEGSRSMTGLVFGVAVLAE